MKYTKGKWLIGKNSFGQRMVGIRVVKKLSKFEGVALICNSSLMEENAAIIVNAPQMYETLLKISKYRNTDAGQLAIKSIKELVK